MLFRSPTRLTLQSDWHTLVSAIWADRYRTGIRMETDTDTRLRLRWEQQHEVETVSRMKVSGVGVEINTDIRSRLRIENDMWYLDGTYLLDGTKLLDAEIIECDL